MKRPGVVAVAVGCACLGLTGTTSAAAPGRDGRIAFRSHELSCSDGGCSAEADDYYRVATADPSGPGFHEFACGMVDGDFGYDPCTDLSPAWSPDGGRIAFEHAGYPPSSPVIEIAGLGGSGGRALPGVHGIQPAWSPDGQRLAYAGPAPTRRDISVVSVAGGRARRLTFRGGQAPNWSVKGEIAFARRTRGGLRNILAVRASGGRARLITRRGGDDPSWSPDGTRVAFDRAPDARHPRRRDIYVVGRDGGGLRRLTFKAGADPAWSPSGDRIAFVRGAYVYWRHVRGGKLHRVVRVADDADQPDWQPLPK